MTTFAALKTSVSRDLRDPSALTFDATTVGDFINEALAEIGRLAPHQFQEDIVLVEDEMEYQLQGSGASQSLSTPFGAASTNVLTCASHGLAAGDAIEFLTLTGGTGLVVGLPYYVIASGLGASSFKVAPIVSGTEVNFTTDVTEGTFRRIGSDDAIPEIEVMNVELWDVTQTPDMPVARVEPSASAYVNYSDTGWRVWDGILQVPRWIPIFTKGSEANYLLRVWGYCPYRRLVNANDVAALSAELEYALRTRCRVSALERLISDRDLFSQWQVRSNNTDVSPAALMNSLSLAQADWRRMSRAITVLREAP